MHAKQRTNIQFVHRQIDIKVLQVNYLEYAVKTTDSLGKMEEKEQNFNKRPEQNKTFPKPISFFNANSPEKGNTTLKMVQVGTRYVKLKSLHSV